MPPEIKIRRTDAAGRFEFTGLAPDCRYHIDVHPPGFATRSILAATCQPGRKGLADRRILVGGIELKFSRPRDVPIAVVYADTGNPAPKVFVEGYDILASSWKSSNNDGRVILKLPAGDFKLHLLPAFGTPYLPSDGTLQGTE